MAPEPVAFANPVKFGDDLELDPRAYELRRAGRALKLERIPMELLLLLVELRGQLVTREQIIERVWGKDVFLDADTSINSAIRKIRTVLKDDPEQPKFIQTVTGRGYRFIGCLTDVVPLTLAPPGRAPVGPNQRLQSAGDLASPAETITQVRRLAVRFHGRAAQAAAGALVLLLFLGAIGHADAVIEGSVTRSADRVRITVQLIDAARDQHLWSESYERETKDIFALQSQVAQAIAEQVHAEVTPEEQGHSQQRHLAVAGQT